LPRLPRVTARQAERAIFKDGWYLEKSSGGHRQYRHAAKGGYVTIALHSGTILAPKTLKSILDQSGLSVDEFIALL
jgi:predicted RNA binding protein YcfA (HicA-like mRNA interferase family)